MTASKSDIIANLKRDVLHLHCFKATANNPILDTMLGPMKNTFPCNSFPLNAIHEFISQSEEDAAGTHGFISGLLGILMQNGGASIWIGASQNIFPPALKSFGIMPEKIIFIQLQKEKEILWAMEEALRCDGLSAVVGEVRELGFNASRRLQLAVEKSGVTGFVVRNNPRSVGTTACVTRWKITGIPSELEDNLPGVGFPRWNVDLLKVRNGKPGTWQIECRAGYLRPVYTMASISPIQKKKTG